MGSAVLKPGPVTQTDNCATVMEHLCPAKFRIVAIKVEDADKHEYWDWLLDPDHRDRLLADREAGRIVTVQGKRDGAWTLYAKLAA